MGRRIFAKATVAALMVALVPAAGAHGAVQLDETFAPNSTTCGKSTFLVTGAPAGRTFAAPFDGVITSWSYQALAIAAQIKLKVARPAVGNTFAFVAESAVETATPNALNTFGTRIPLRSGDVIGFYLAIEAPCFRTGAPATGWHGQNFLLTDVPVGTTATSSSGDLANTQYDVSALLEPDADQDGFGDETQDQCPTDASTQGPCPDGNPPDTTITEQPKNKTKKRRATFEFSANEPATFNCMLDGRQQFKACTSPFTIKVKRGKHILSVTATDAAGNADPTPATDNWKVTKKKKRK